TAAKRETRATRQPGPGGTAAPEGVKPVGWGVAAGTAVAITGPVLGAAGGDAAAVDGARAAASRAGADAVPGGWGIAAGTAVAAPGPVRGAAGIDGARAAAGRAWAGAVPAGWSGDRAVGARGGDPPTSPVAAGGPAFWDLADGAGWGTACCIGDRAALTGARATGPA